MSIRQNLTGVPDAIIKNRRAAEKNSMELNLFNQQIAEVKCSYSHSIKARNRAKVTSSDEAAKLVIPIWEDIDYRETFAVLLLSRSNTVLGLSKIGTGGISGVSVDVKLIFQAALLACSSSIIAVHNHPSGNLTASDADIKITNKIKAAGVLLDIQLMDHIIISSNGYLSMVDEGFI